MTQQVRTFARRSLWMLPVWAAMLFLGTLTHQPDPQTDFGGFAAYVTTTSFLLSHLINSITGAAIGSCICKTQKWLDGQSQAWSPP